MRNYSEFLVILYVQIIVRFHILFGALCGTDEWQGNCDYEEFISELRRYLLGADLEDSKVFARLMEKSLLEIPEWMFANIILQHTVAFGRLTDIR